MKNKTIMVSAIVGFIAVLVATLFLNFIFALLFGIAYLFWPLLLAGVVIGGITFGIIYYRSRKKQASKKMGL